MSFDEQPDPLSDCLEHCDKMKQQLLDASLENKRLRDAYSKYAGHFNICKIFDDMTDGGDTTNQCDCGFEKVNPFTDHSELAGLYLELREQGENILIALDDPLRYDLGKAQREVLRDILKRIRRGKK